MSGLTDRFLRYISIHTTSSETSGEHPSTKEQFVLAKILRDELVKAGASDVFLDEEHCYVYARIPSNIEGYSGKCLGFIAHMDTSPETSGEGVTPRFVENYDGGDITLNSEKNIVLSPEVFPDLLAYKGQTIIVTDGTTLLGADDKAGVAEIMDMTEYLLSHPEVKHGDIAVAFTPDEEIGEGPAFFDIGRFGADHAYTVDGGKLGEIEYENFNAAAAIIEFTGRTVHPGEAKNKMINASCLATEFDRMLPQQSRPEYTEKREGFFYLTEMSGTTDHAKLSYIIRDHDRTLFEEKKELIGKIAGIIEMKYGKGTVSVSMRDQYYNMYSVIYPDNMFLVENAVSVMKKLGVEPIIQPVRGGTDGATLSLRGLPCPNLCTGGHNYHGIYEYVPVESMEKTREILIELACSD